MGRDPVVREDRVGGVDPLPILEQHHPDPLAAQGGGDRSHFDLRRHGHPLALGNVGDAHRLEGVIGGGLRVWLEGARANHEHCARRLRWGICSRGGTGATQDLLASDESAAESLHELEGEGNPRRAHGDVVSVDAEWRRNARHVRQRLVPFNADSEEHEGGPEGVT